MILEIPAAAFPFGTWDIRAEFTGRHLDEVLVREPDQDGLGEDPNPCEWEPMSDLGIMVDHQCVIRHAARSQLALQSRDHREWDLGEER